MSLTLRSCSKELLGLEVTPKAIHRNGLFILMYQPKSLPAKPSQAIDPYLTFELGFLRLRIWCFVTHPWKKVELAYWVSKLLDPVPLVELEELTDICCASPWGEELVYSNNDEPARVLTENQLPENLSKAGALARAAALFELITRTSRHFQLPEKRTAQTVRRARRASLR